MSNENLPQITCDICAKKVNSSKSYSRWNMCFCSKKCHNVIHEIKKKEEEEKQNNKNTLRTGRSDTFGGNAY